MTVSVHFAHISDIHLSKDGNERFMMSDEAAAELRPILARLNAMPDLDFIFIGGDCLHHGHEEELARFRALLEGVEKPLLVIPGNHDGNLSDDPQVFTQRRFAAVFNPQFADRPATGQAGYFSVAVGEGAQFIGLDTSLPGQVGGAVDAAQLDWLREELSRHSDRLVIIGCHHPLHPLCPQDRQGKWRDWFVCANGEAVQSVLDAHPSARLVLCGHHHANHVFRRGNQLHMAAPPLATYPCAYRLVRLTGGGDDLRIGWQTFTLPESVRAEAALRLQNSSFALEFDPQNGKAFVEFAAGRPFDRAFEGAL